MEALLSRLGQINLAAGELEEMTSDLKPGETFANRSALLDELAVKLDEIRALAVLALEIVDSERV